MKIKSLLRQYHIPYLGGLKDIAMMTVFYMSIINFILIATTAYYTTLRPFILEHAPWFKLWMFIGALVVVALCGMVLEYKFMYASYFTFRNKQEFEHQNLIRLEIEKLREDLRISKAEEKE